MEFCQDTADAICQALAEGKALTKICKQDGMPSYMTVYKWKRENPAFAEDFAHAREDQADTYFDEVMEIADDKSLEPHDRRVRIDTRLKVAARLKPKKYGDKQHLTHAGDPENPLHATDTKSDAELERIASGGVTSKPEQRAN